jgi:glucan endo-1,3-alpha-glucosidase
LILYVSRGLENDQLIRAQSSYIGPVRRKWQQPAYAQDMPHTAWLLLSQFYIQRYKTGAYPRVKVRVSHKAYRSELGLQKDTLIYWYRTHSKDAVARSDPLGPPAGWDSTEDAIYVLALLASPHASLVVKTGIIQTNSTLVQGLNRVKIEFVEGPVSLRLQQNGKTTAIAEPGPPISNTIDGTYLRPDRQPLIFPQRTTLTHLSEA